jgi:cytochrome c556
MQEHFAKAAEMKAAVIGGNLAEFKKVAAWMAEHELTKDPPQTWKTHVDAMQSCAKRGRDAADLAAASLALGEVGRTCRECHSAMGAPKISVGSPPAEGSGALLRMVRHQWAADRMWEGLMAPSDDAWVKGAEVFSDAPLTPEEVAPGKSVSPEVKKLAKDAQDIAHKARTVDEAKRHEAYADLLTTCQRCHTAAK